MKKTISILLIIIMISGLIVGCSNDVSQDVDKPEEPAEVTQDVAKPEKVLEIKCSTCGPEDHPFTIAAEIFKEEVEKLSDGKVHIEIFPNSMLGGEREVAESIMMGSIEMAVLCPDAVLPLWIPEITALSVPYIFEDKEDAYRKLDGIVTELLDPYYEEAGFKNLGYAELGFRHFTNNKREIKTADDIKGLKFRVLEAPIWFTFIEQLGGIPTPVPFDELYTALQQGVVDGQENPLATIAVQKFYETQKYLTLDGHTYATGSFLFNLDFYDSLSEEQQEWMKKASRVAIDEQRKIITGNDDAYLKLLKEEGMEIYEPEKETFIEATKDMVDLPAIKAIVDPELVKQIRDN